MEAIFLASPSLYNQLGDDRFLANSAVKNAFLSYLIRMGSRPTPFGLFAGCSIGKFAEKSSLNLQDKCLKTNYSLDARVLWQLSQYLVGIQSLWSFLTYQPNTSLYKLGELNYYIDILKGKEDFEYHQTEIKRTRVLDILFSRSGKVKTYAELVEMLVEEGYEKEKVCLLLEQLISDQLLVSELSINTTGTDYLTRIIQLVKEIPGQYPLCKSLEKLQNVLNEEIPVQAKHDSIQSILQERIGLPLGSYPLIKADALISDVSIQLHKGRIIALQKTLEKLFNLRVQHNDSCRLEQFKKAFYQRYQEQEVPLMTALNEETGIDCAYYQPQVDDHIIDRLNPNPRARNKESSANENELLNQWLLRKYLNWLDSDETVLNLSDNDLNDLPQTKKPLPSSYYALGYFLATSTKAIDNGQFTFRAKYIAGPSAFNLLGRFGSVDTKLGQKLKKNISLFRKGEDEVIYAEIVHIPNAISGNVLHRPVLSDYEIPYLGYSTLPHNNQITVDDLLISITQDGNIILRSKRLGKRVIPCLTTAHNYHSGLPIYRFLCDLEHEDTSLKISWNWGPLRDARHLPRVQYRNVIMCEAQWKLTLNDYNTGISNMANIVHWRGQWKWPKYMALAEGDQELLIDIDSELTGEIVISALKKQKIIYLFEWLRNLDSCCVESRQGKESHEVIIPFRQKKNIIKQLVNDKINIKHRQVFIPGSEWLFIKLSGSRKAASSLLKRVGEILDVSFYNKQISHWFFKREITAGVELEIYIHLNTQKSLNEVLDRCQKEINAFVKTGEIHTVQLDSYKRETDNCSMGDINTIEKCYWLNSKLTISIHNNHNGIDDVICLIMYTVENYLTIMGFSDENKQRYYLKRFESLIESKDLPSETGSLLAREYRKRELAINKLFREEEKVFYKEQKKLIDKRNEQIKKITMPLINNQEEFTEVETKIHAHYINCFTGKDKMLFELMAYHHLLKRHKRIHFKSLKVNAFQ
ncbi:hypothetical protein GCM10028806_09530 [Spirosoma terrae]